MTPMTEAQARLDTRVLDWTGCFGGKLMSAEYVYVVTSALSRSVRSFARELIRTERHGAQGKPGGIE